MSQITSWICNFWQIHICFNLISNFITSCRVSLYGSWVTRHVKVAGNLRVWSSIPGGLVPRVRAQSRCRQCLPHWVSLSPRWSKFLSNERMKKGQRSRMTGEHPYHQMRTLGDIDHLLMPSSFASIADGSFQFCVDCIVDSKWLVDGLWGGWDLISLAQVWVWWHHPFYGGMEHYTHTMSAGQRHIDIITHTKLDQEFGWEYWVFKFWNLVSTKILQSWVWRRQDGWRLSEEKHWKLIIDLMKWIMVKLAKYFIQALVSLDFWMVALSKVQTLF